MNNQDKNNLVQKIGYRLAQITASTIVGCFLALLVALTIKAIMFMF